MDKPKIFISHRHDDEKLAEIVTKHLREWGINADWIFRSSDPQGGLSAGDKLNEELITNLKQVNLLILLYTYSDVDWSYCMWECGITEGKATARTRIVVFQCTEDEPTVFRHEVKVKVSPNGIRSFTEDFHRKPDFFPVSNDAPPTPFSPEVSEDAVAARSERLFAELDDAIPSGKSSSKHLWDFIRLHIDPDDVRELKILSNNKEVVEKLDACVQVREPRFIGIGNSVDTAVRQFGYGSYEADLKFGDLLNRWKSQDKTKDRRWIEDLYQAIHRAITNTPSGAVSNTLKSVREDANWWFFPIVTRMRTYRDESMEFDVYLVRVPSPPIASEGESTSKRRPASKKID